MESEASFPTLSPLMDTYPEQAGALYNTYSDLTLSQQWLDIRLHDLSSAGFGVLFAHKTAEDPHRLILPLPFHAQSLTPASLRSIFAALSRLEMEDLGEVVASPLSVKTGDVNATGEGDADLAKNEQVEDGPDQHQEQSPHEQIDKETIYVSIVTSDSSTVYYKLTKGIKKPTDVPDE